MINEMEKDAIEIEDYEVQYWWTKIIIYGPIFILNLVFCN